MFLEKVNQLKENHGRLMEKLKKLFRAVKCGDVPLLYMITFLITKFYTLLWGILVLRKNKVYLHHSSTIKCKSRLNITGKLVIDSDCYIDALSKEGVTFGDTVALGMKTVIICTSSIESIGKGLKVGNHSSLGTHGFYGCAGGISIGDNVLIGNYVSMHSENHNFEDPNLTIREQGVSHKGITIGNDCWIGSKVTILDGAQVGDGCIIAAGAVVRGNIPPYSVVGGIPARLLKKRE